MLVTWESLKSRHPNTSKCTNGVDRKRHRPEVEEMLMSEEIAFQAYGLPLKLVTSLKYHGQILAALYDDCLAVVWNLMKARMNWARFLIFLGWEENNPRLLGMLFKEVVQVVLLFGLETWAMNPHMERSLGGFQHRAARHITVRQPEGFWMGVGSTPHQRRRCRTRGLRR